MGAADAGAAIRTGSLAVGTRSGTFWGPRVDPFVPLLLRETGGLAATPSAALFRPRNRPAGQAGHFGFSKMSRTKRPHGLRALNGTSGPVFGTGQRTLSLRSVRLSRCPEERLTV